MERTWKPIAGGILSIIAAALGIGGGIFLMAAGRFVDQWGRVWGGMIGEAMGVGPPVIVAVGAITYFWDNSLNRRYLCS